MRRRVVEGAGKLLGGKRRAGAGRGVRLARPRVLAHLQAMSRVRDLQVHVLVTVEIDVIAPHTGAVASEEAHAQTIEPRMHTVGDLVVIPAQQAHWSSPAWQHL